MIIIVYRHRWNLSWESEARLHDGQKATHIRNLEVLFE